jgi:hypothetical protein
MTTINNDLDAKLCSIFSCNICDYTTCKKSSFDKHCDSKKHKNNYLTTINNDLVAKSCSKKNYVCEKCIKTFCDRAGLWRHKKKCQILNINNENIIEELNKQITPELIISILHQNKEFQNMLIEQNKTIVEMSKNSSNTNNTINTINSHNKTFNLQVFLNETCKDAMNIMDFVNSLKIELSDLENVGNVGYVNGISSIIVKNLNLLDETKRPVHCADTKREVMYVKDDNKWEKDNENKSQMRKIIKHATHKNSKLLKEYKAKYPGCEKSESKYSYAYDKLIVETFGGKGDDEIGKENKIIRNIAKNVTISKYNE